VTGVEHGVEEAVEGVLVAGDHRVVGAGHCSAEVETEHAADVLRGEGDAMLRAATAPDRRTAPWSLRQRLVEALFLNQLQRRQAGRHRHRIAGQRAGLVDRPERGDPFHDLALPPKAPSGMPPPITLPRSTGRA
jgi:hypothetical protein